jgi:hypothetical protein
MPAKLVISAGSSAPAAEVWVERSFLKVGTAAGNDVRVQPAAGVALADVAAYIQFRDGRYEVFNKDCAAAAIGPRSIPRGASAPWPAGERLRLEDAVEIDLIVDGDPTPAPRGIARETAPSASPRPAEHVPAPAQTARSVADAAPRTAPRVGGRQMAQLVVTAVCLLACVLMVAAKKRTGSAADTGNAVFDRLVSDVLSPPAPGDKAAASDGIGDDGRRLLVQRLQAAEAAFRTGDKKSARSRYEQIKRWLDPVRSAQDDAFMRRLASFVDYRVTALEKSKQGR